MEELYDIEKDPRELTNLALNPAYQGVVERLRASMVEQLRLKHAGLVDHMPPPRGV
jgi:hypothetical protein